MSTDKWGTPTCVYDPLHKEFKFDEFDPCPIDWEPGDPDGLEIEWAPRTFVNPPYSQLRHWLKKASEECEKGKLVVMLIPNATDSHAFHKYVVNKGHTVRFIKGRVRFVHRDGFLTKNPFKRPSIVIVMNPNSSPST